MRSRRWRLRSEQSKKKGRKQRKRAEKVEGMRVGWSGFLCLTKSGWKRRAMLGRLRRGESESWPAMREGEVSNGVVQESDRDVKKKSDARVLEPEEFTGG